MGLLRSESAVQGLWAAVITGVVSIIVTIAAIWFGQARGILPSPAPAPTVTVTAAAPTPTPAPTVTVTATATATVTAEPSPTDTEGSSANVLYLDDLDPVEDSLLVSEVASFDGVDYIHSLTNPMASCSQAGPVTWVLPEETQRLIGEIGVAADAAEPEARVAFVVRSGSEEVYAETFTVGEHTELNVPVDGGERLTIENRFIPEDGFRGNCNTEAVAVWGDLRAQ